MPRGLLGRKVGMTQVFVEDGSVVPVTVLEVGPCTVLQVRTPEKDGYSAIQLGFGEKPRRLAIRSELGRLANVTPADSKTLPTRYVREFRTEGSAKQYTAGQVLKADCFVTNELVDVVGATKGRGFTGVMKKYNFSGLCASHGVKKVHRSGGSTGQRQDPGRVFKGQKMSGHWGGERITVKNLKVVRVDLDTNTVLVRGAVPGHNGAFVMIRPGKSGKAQRVLDDILNPKEKAPTKKK